jgi:hypothetical protein
MREIEWLKPKEVALNEMNKTTETSLCEFHQIKANLQQ